MKRAAPIAAGLLFCLLALATVCQAGASDPLFINLTSDDGHRSLMAISFGQNQLQRGHPLTVYLNDKAVLIASKKNGGQFARPHCWAGDDLDATRRVPACHPKPAQRAAHPQPTA